VPLTVIAGLYLIAALGLETCFRVLIFAYIAIGVWLAIALGRRAVARTRWQMWAAASVLMTIGLFPRDVMRDVYQPFPIYMLTRAGEQRVAFKEGQLETLQYLRGDVLGRPNYYRLVVNNHSMSASEVRSRRYMRSRVLPRCCILRPERRRHRLVPPPGPDDDDRLDTIDVVDT
jgi:hypothetical protein